MFVSIEDEADFTTVVDVVLTTTDFTPYSEDKGIRKAAPTVNRITQLLLEFINSVMPSKGHVHVQKCTLTLIH